VPVTHFEGHRVEIQRFAGMVRDDAVLFHSMSYSELIARGLVKLGRRYLQAQPSAASLR
jgi:hypothetical protein